MGQCCGFVKSDKPLTTSQREERYKEIEQAIQKIDDMDKKNELLSKLNGRPSISNTKESYDQMQQHHKIYQGPNKNNSNLNVISKEDLGSQLSNKKSVDVIQLDQTQQGESQIKVQENETQQGELKGSQQNIQNLEIPSNQNVDNNGKEAEQQASNSNQENNNKPQKITKELSKQMDQKDQNMKSSSQQNITTTPSKNNDKEQQNSKPNGGLKKSTKDKEQGKVVGFDLEDIDREMKKSGRFNKVDGAQTDYDNQSTTKTEKQVKGVLKKYSDVASCYTGDGDTKSVKKKGKKVKFKDPQKPKKKASKRQYH